MDSLDANFVEWYSLVVPKFEKEQLAARLQAVSDIAQGLTAADVTKLVRQFYELPADSTYAEHMRSVLRKRDEKYISSNDAAELAIIAGAVIFTVTSKPSSVANALALGVFCAEAAGMRKTARIDSVVVRCHNYLSEEAVKLREQGFNHPKVSAEKLPSSIKGLQAHHAAGLPAYGPAIEDILVKVVTSLNGYSSDLNREISRIEKLRIEESNILFWLLGESTRAGIHYSKLNLREACFLVALDLAEMTEILPGPAASLVFMRRMLKLAEKSDGSETSILDSVAALDHGRRSVISAKFLPKDPVLMPILFAVAKAQESGGGGWNAAFSAQTFLSENQKLEAIRLSEQLYSELLLLRAIS